MTNTTVKRTYTPDPLVVAGAKWARNRGIPNHKFSVLRTGNHAHVINCMFDMNTLAAVVEVSTGPYMTRVTAAGACHLCGGGAR